MRLAILLIAISGILSCQSSQENKNKISPRKVRFAKVISPKPSYVHRINEEVQFEIKSKKDIDSIVLRYKNQRKLYLQPAFSWSPSSPQVGKLRVGLAVYTQNEKVNITARVMILPDKEPKSYGYRIINTYPHDEGDYVQGLFFNGDTLYESTGQDSKLKKYDLSGRVYKQIELDDQFFGEGIVLHKEKIFQLTWNSEKAFVYDLNLKQIQEYQYTGEGWGITNYKDKMIMSNGTHLLKIIDPNSFTQIDEVQVCDYNGVVESINELELINNKLFANIYTTNNVLIIDVSSGIVEGVIDLSGLWQEQPKSTNHVLNGIAYHKKDDKLIVTGKLWPYLYEIEIFEKS